LVRSHIFIEAVSANDGMVAAIKKQTDWALKRRSRRAQAEQFEINRLSAA
jgi:hypothetical protein